MDPMNLTEQLTIHDRILAQTVRESSTVVEEIGVCLVECFRQGNKLLLCGNGGSAADSQHMAAEFVNRFKVDRAALPAVALTVDSSILTAIGNDSSFEKVFSRQVQALGKPGDVLAAISTSGGSPNVLKAIDAAHSAGMKVIGFTGEKGRQSMAPKCDLCLVVSSTDTPRIQEVHQFVWHALCGMVEQTLFNA
jgi:D-sedoheptulose 7-phosphate isomerase